MKRIDELAEKVEWLESTPQVGIDGQISQRADWAELRKQSFWLIRVARAAEMATGAYWGASNELEAMQELRAALDNSDAA